MPVSAIGYLGRHGAWFSYGHSPDLTGGCVFAFSLVIAGSGRFVDRSGSQRLKAPFVISRWRGVEVSYGPDAQWEEIYFAYHERVNSALERRGLAAFGAQAFALGDATRVLRAYRELRQELDSAPKHSIDRLDRSCETLMLEAMLERAHGCAQSPEQERDPVERIRGYIERNFHQQIDFDALAREHALSRASFRRHWAASVGVAPGRYVQRLRLDAARELLASERVGVQHVAAMVGFEDPAYFSRAFRKRFGFAPSSVPSVSEPRRRA
jgi:AraC-like DNA-binding protein